MNQRTTDIAGIRTCVLRSSELVQEYLPGYSLPAFVKDAQKQIEQDFGITDLTIIEKSDLLKICENVSELYASQLEQFEKGELHASSVNHQQKKLLMHGWHRHWV